MTTRYTWVTLLAVGLAVPAAFAGETVTEHESYEKRSMKIETIPPPRVQERAVEETETTRTETERRPADAQIEKRTTVVPGPVIREKTTEQVETE